jgi:hypothetical protein
MQAITKDIALQALRIAGTLRLDFFESEAELRDYVDGWIDDYLREEKIRLGSDELQQLRDEVYRRAKKRNNEIFESPQWEPDDLDDTIEEAISNNVDRLRVGKKPSNLARDPFGVSTNPNDVNAAIAATETKKPVTTIPLRSGLTISSAAPKLSQPSTVSPADAPEPLDDAKRAKAEEQVNRYRQKLAGNESLNADQTTSYLNRLRQLQGHAAAQKAWDEDAKGLLDADGGDRYFKEHDQRRRGLAPTQPQSSPTSQQNYRTRPNPEELQRMGSDHQAIGEYANRRRRESNNPSLPPRITEGEIEASLSSVDPQLRQQVSANLAKVRQLRAGPSLSGATQQPSQSQRPAMGSSGQMVAQPRQYSQRKVECNPAVSKLCGGTCIPKDHECHEGAKKLERVTAQLEAVPQALKNAEALGQALGLPVTDPKKPMAMANAAAAFEAQSRQALPFLGEGVWQGMAKATNFMVRASVIGSGVVAAWAAFKNAGGAINPGFKRALDVAEQDAFSGIQKMAGAALRPLTDPFEARMARQESQVRSQLGGMAQQATAGLRGPGLRSVATVGGALASNENTKWYAQRQRAVDNDYANDFGGWLKQSAILATNPSTVASESLGQRRFAREYAGDIKHADLSKESLIDIADRATRGFADDLGSRMARLGKDPDALKLSDFEALVPRKTLERFNPRTNTIEERTNDVFRKAVALSMYNRYQIGRRPASQRRQELENQLTQANTGAKAELAGLNRFIQGLTSLDPKAPRANRQAEGQQRERVILALARARGYQGGTAAAAYGFLKERHAQLPKQRGDSQQRTDKKCGNSGIPDNAKCSKETETNTKPPKDSEPTPAQAKPETESNNASTIFKTGAVVASIGLAVGGAAWAADKIQDPKFREFMVTRLQELNTKAAENDQQLNQLIDNKLPEGMREQARNLVGKSKVALTRWALAMDAVPIDSVKVDAENNLFTYKMQDGSMVGMTSVGTKVVVFGSRPDESMQKRLNHPAYEMLFSVNHTVDASKSGGANRKETLQIAKQVNKLFDQQMSELPDGALVTNTPFKDDGKGATRARIYEKFGFGTLENDPSGRMWAINVGGKPRVLSSTESQRLGVALGYGRKDSVDLKRTWAHVA